MHHVIAVALVEDKIHEVFGTDNKHFGSEVPRISITDNGRLVIRFVHRFRG